MGQYIQTRIVPNREMVEGILDEFPWGTPPAYTELWGGPRIRLDNSLKRSTQKKFLGEKFGLYIHLNSIMLDSPIGLIYNRLL